MLPATALDHQPPIRRLHLVSPPPPSSPRRPTAPELQGIAGGIDDVLQELDRTNRSVKELSGNVGSLEARVVHHGIEILDLKESHRELAAVVGGHGEKLAEQSEKLEEVARLRHLPQPIHRTAPGAILVPAKTPSIPPLADIGERQPTGSFKVQAASWDILNDRVQKIEQQGREDRLRAETAEATLKKVKDDSDRTVRILSFCLAVAVAFGAVIAFVWKLHG
jgi:hypothetical protein